VSILFRFRVIASYLPKVADFNVLHLHFEFRKDIWRQETRVTGLSCRVVYMTLWLAVLVEHRLVTDGLTDTTTTAYRANIASRSKTYFIFQGNYALLHNFFSKRLLNALNVVMIICAKIAYLRT